MERLLQYLDDLDDFYGMVGFVSERLRRYARTLFSFLSVGVGATAGVWLALLHPPIALASLTLLFVTLLYRSVTVPSSRWLRV